MRMVFMMQHNRMHASDVQVPAGAMHGPTYVYGTNAVLVFCTSV